jgi:hypothetical protein
MAFFKKFNDSYQKSLTAQDPGLAKRGFIEKVLLFSKYVLEYLFGLKDVPLIDVPFPRDDIERYFYLRSDRNAGAADRQTIKDLDVVKYTDQFFDKTSIFGQQILHDRLRCGENDTEAGLAKNRYTTMIEDNLLFEHLREVLKPLREVVTEVSDFLFVDRVVSIPGWVKYSWVLPFVSITSFLLSAVHWVAILGFVSSFFVIVYIQIITYNEMSVWEPKRISLYSLMKTADALGTGIGVKSELIAQFEDPDGVRKEVVNLLRPSRLEVLVPWVGEYADWFLLKNIIRYFRCLKSVEKHKNLIRDIYLKVGNLEADVAVARHLRQCSQYCWVDRHDNNQIVMNEVVNPFLLNALPMSVTFGEKGIFLSGQNGVGKSTFLRTIGINMLVARAFGFCYARSASFLTCPVYTSIQIEDSLIGGESLYMAELRRAKELLVSSDGPGKGIYIIDEIFRGTNHLESVAAAASFLNALSRQSTVLISSHNLVLAPLLSGRLEALCIQRVDDDSNKLTITRGVLADPNGISLMASYDFGNEIQDESRRIHRWLGEYLAHPTNFPELV